MEESTSIKSVIAQQQDILAELGELNVEKSRMAREALRYAQDMEAFWAKHPEAREGYDAMRILNQELMTDCAKRMEALQESIKAKILDLGATVKNGPVQAVYVKGKTSWESAKLDGYAEAHPEIKAFKKVGNPSVSIKWEGGK